MLLTPYRAQLQTALVEVPSQRKPFLRRSLRADALLTTDLPCVAAEADIADFVSRLRAQGWRVEALGNYLVLTPTLHPPICTETPAWERIGRSFGGCIVCLNVTRRARPRKRRYWPF